MTYQSINSEGTSWISSSPARPRSSPGATKGIGRAVAETLLDEGASVAICARTAEDVEQA
jgi:hypothetical protein